MAEISKLEIAVLRKIYPDYEKTGERKNWPTTQIFKDLRIKDGTYVGTLNSSRFVNLVQENFQISDEGIRFMDNVKTQKANKGEARKPILDRDLKILWGRAGNRCSICNKELVHEKTETEQGTRIRTSLHENLASRLRRDVELD